MGQHSGSYGGNLFSYFYVESDRLCVKVMINCFSVLLGVYVGLRNCWWREDFNDRWQIFSEAEPDLISALQMLRECEID